MRWQGVANDGGECKGIVVRGYVRGDGEGSSRVNGCGLCGVVVGWWVVVWWANMVGVCWVEVKV